MIMLEWSESLASGSPEIDAQHKELFARVNGLLAAFEKGSADRGEIDRIVSYLDEYVVFHFGTEEKYMDRFRYSSAPQHKAQHVQFVKVFSKLKDRMSGEGINAQLGQDMKDLVVDWLVNHIMFSDRALGMFLRQKAH